MQDVKCRCGNKLGEREGDVWALAQRGRLYLVQTVFAIHCERCGSNVVPGTDAPVPAIDIEAVRAAVN